MPGSYVLDPSQRVVFTRAWGDLTFDDISAHATTLRADRRFDPDFKQIIDFRDVARFTLTSADVRNLADLTPFHRDARRAFVVGSDEAFGLARMFAAYRDADRGEFGIFREMGAGMEWIGLDPQTPWPTQAPDATFGKE